MTVIVIIIFNMMRMKTSRKSTVITIDSSMARLYLNLNNRKTDETTNYLATLVSLNFALTKLSLTP